MENGSARRRLPLLHSFFSRRSILYGQPEAHIHDAPADSVRHPLWDRRLPRNVLDRDAAFEFSQETFLLVCNCDRHHHAHDLCRNPNLPCGQSVLKTRIIEEHVNGRTRHKVL